MCSSDLFPSHDTQRADAQNLIRQMREQNKKADKIEQNVAAVTGATPEAVNAGKERRNKMTTDVYSNIAANAMQFKESAKNRYLSRKQQWLNVESPHCSVVICFQSR